MPGVLAFLGKVVDAVASALPLFFAWRAGASGVKADQAAKTSEVQGDQLDIAARPNVGRDALLDRMRRDGL
ncbi:MAG: hypothetical protein GC150_15435 [Rhizobiales bacterium]|nr:hypothetical protein [Hyphomicrobiales bacterium]